jgi:hypothetical protein
MTHYRIYLFDTADHLLSGEEFERASDTAAVAAAVVIAHAAEGLRPNAIEIWEGERRVARLVRGLPAVAKASASVGMARSTHFEVAAADVVAQSVQQPSAPHAAQA